MRLLLRSITLRVAQKLRIAFVAIAFIVFAFGQAGSALADTCPSGMSQLDCNALYGNWTDWVPDNGSACGASTVLTGSDNVQKAFNYFIQKGLTDFQAAGIIGNLEQESGQGLNPNSQEKGGTSATPVAGTGFGIAQWTTAGRQQALVAFAAQEGKPATDLGVQLDFLWQELTTSYPNVLQNLKASTDVQDATLQFMGPTTLSNGSAGGGYENPGKPFLENRTTYAEQVLSVYGNGVSSGAVSACGITCNSSDTSTDGLSQVRQSVVCIAQQELAAWTPPPAIPRLEFTKYTEGQTGTVAAPEEWCADFASWVYNQAGYPLQPAPAWRTPAVATIQTIGQGNQNFHWHNLTNSNGVDYDPSYTPKPGDLAIHGGNHVNIVISVAGNTVTLIGGDQGGGPYGGPTSASVVSTEVVSSYTGGGEITGYVSPD